MTNGLKSPNLPSVKQFSTVLPRSPPKRHFDRSLSPTAWADFAAVAFHVHRTKKRQVMNQKETAMSEENKSEKKKPLHDWSFMVMPNPPPGVRERSLKYFRDNPVSVTIRPARELHPAAQPKKRDGDGKGTGE